MVHQIDFLTFINIKCIDYALKSNDPTEIMLEITKQLNEDDAKIQSGFFSGKFLGSLSHKIYQ